MRQEMPKTAKPGWGWGWGWDHECKFMDGMLCISPRRQSSLES